MQIWLLLRKARIVPVLCRGENLRYAHGIDEMPAPPNFSGIAPCPNDPVVHLSAAPYLGLAGRQGAITPKRVGREAAVVSHDIRSHAPGYRHRFSRDAA